MTTTSLIAAPTPGLWSRPRAALALRLMPRSAAGTHVVPCHPAYLSPLGWLALQTAALWPHGLWLLRRVQDGSDDPLGLAAIGMLVLLLWRLAPRLRVAPQLGWLGASAVLTGLATLALFVAPPLVAALVAALALATGLMAWLPPKSPRLPFAGLALLALPLVSSLQYYGGYPLRLITAQLSTWALQLAGLAAERSGAAMLVNGQLVIVDAPCSGVQMVWMAYFCACAVAALRGLRDASFLARLPLVGLSVLIGNVLRNSVLVTLESRPQGLHEHLHQAIGLAALGAVCLAVLVLMRGMDKPFGLSPSKPGADFGPFDKLRANGVSREPWFQRHWPATLAMVLTAGALMPLVLPERGALVAVPAHTEWPQTWEGRDLRPLSTNAVEQRFAARFPGAIARFTDGERVLVLRRVDQPTRMLHPAADCFRGLGYRIEQARLERDARARLWRCFEASPTRSLAGSDGERLRVCERIEAPDGTAFTDPSAWFWAASLGQSSGPWQAITVVEVL